MAKPTIMKITPLDATKDNIISMSYAGNLPYSNRIIISDAMSLAVIYDNTATNTNFTIEHTIPANTLVNGKKYVIQGQVFDINGNASVLSDKSYFWCLATPLFYFSNVTDGEVFDTASIYANLSYEQSDFEDINEYRYYLYDDVKNLLLESETFYGIDNFSYAYRGLNDDKFYYIRALGNTINGLQLDTGYIKIFINYENPEDYKLIQAECNDKNSIVTYQTSFVVINPTTHSSEYEYNNGWIDLTNKTLVYDENFVVSGDFTMSIRGKEMYKNATVLKCSNSEKGFTLSSYIYDDGKMRYKLTVPNGLCNYILYSEPISPGQNDIVSVHIRRINNIYQLYCFVEFNENEEQTNMWFSATQPSISQLDNYDIWINMDNEGTVRIDKNDVNIFYQKDEPILLVEKDYDIWIGGEE